MARRTRRRSTRRSNSSRLFKKRARCPSSVRRVCKIVKTRGSRKNRQGTAKQVCQVTAGSFRSKWVSAGVAQRRAINLKARLAKRGCSPSLSTSLGRYGRRRRSR